MFGGAAAAALLLAASFAATGVEAQDKTQRVVRGVNLGGWLVTEPWYVLPGSQANLLLVVHVVVQHAAWQGKGLRTRVLMKMIG